MFKLSKYIFITSLFTALILKVYLSIEIGTYGHAFSEIEQQIERISNENILQSEKIKSDTSLTKIISKSITYGFSNPQNIIYIKSEKPLASIK